MPETQRCPDRPARWVRTTSTPSATCSPRATWRRWASSTSPRTTSRSTSPRRRSRRPVGTTGTAPSSATAGCGASSRPTRSSSTSTSGRRTTTGWVMTCSPASRSGPARLPPRRVMPSRGPAWAPTGRTSAPRTGCAQPATASTPPSPGCGSTSTRTGPDEAPPQTDVVVRRVTDEADLRVAHDIDEESFLEHYGNVPISFESWRERLTDRGEDFSQVYLADVDGAPVGLLISTRAVRAGRGRRLRAHPRCPARRPRPRGRHGVAARLLRPGPPRRAARRCCCTSTSRTSPALCGSTSRWGCVRSWRSTPGPRASASADAPADAG